MKKSVVVFVALALILAALPVIEVTSAQAPQDEHPLLQMLALVPDNLAVRVGPNDSPSSFAPWVTFVDYRAALEADPVYPYPANFAEYAAQTEQGREKWQYAPLRIWTEPGLPYLWNGTNTAERDPETLGFGKPLVGEAMETLTGMDYFDIHTGMAFGRPPLNGMIFGGDLDVDAIGAAHLARGYTEDTVQGVRVWCSGKSGGCEEGSTFDREGIEPYNVFDSRVGRQPPFFGAETGSAGYIAGAFDYTLLLDMIDTAVDSSDSLADAPDYRTLTGAILDPAHYSGDLIQAYFIPAITVDSQIDLITHAVMAGLNIEEEWPPEEWTVYGTLPAYSMMALADRQEGDDVVTIIALLYGNEARAEAALPELILRLTTYTSAFQHKLPEPVLETRPGHPAVQESYVYTHPETGWSVAVVALRNDVEYTNDEGETITNANTLYPFFVSEINAQLFYAVWTADFAAWVD